MAGCGHVLELHYNAALLAHRQGDLQEALSQVSCVGRSEQLAGWLAGCNKAVAVDARQTCREAYGPQHCLVGWMAAWLPASGVTRTCLCLCEQLQVVSLSSVLMV